MNTTDTTQAQSTFLLDGCTAINRLGYGAMRLTGQPGNFGPYTDWEGGKALLQQASTLGINFFDSARSYGPLFSDQILGEALGNTHAVLATKGGVDKPAPGKITVDGSRDTLLREVDEALKNLQRDQVDLFQLHRVDPATPIEESVAALAEAVEDGRVKHIGLSNVTREELDRALSVAPIASVQNRFNRAETNQSDLVDYTFVKNIAFIPYGPLGASPMKQGALLNPLEAIVWLLNRSPNIVVIPGTTSIDHLVANWAAWDHDQIIVKTDY